MALSDLIVRQAKTTGKRYTLHDNDCLSLMVSAAGGKSWIFRYCWLRKQKRMSLGGYPALSLREARAERDKAQSLLARGIDPQIERDQRRHAARLAGEYTFKNVFDAWVEHRRKELKEGRQSTLSQILRIFNKDVLPTLGKMSIYDIRRPQLLRKAGKRPQDVSPYIVPLPMAFSLTDFRWLIEWALIRLHC